jgi:hypothetical protein
VSISWSYSSISVFKQCPKKYFHLRIAKDVVDESSIAATYGKEFHTAAELYVKDNVKLPSKFNFALPKLKEIEKIKGIKLCEIKLGIKKEKGKYTPCNFLDKNVWWRGIADLIVINKDKNEAYLIDYKTSKNSKYADLKQLDLLAGALFLHCPKLKTIKSGLLFVMSNEFIKKKHTIDKKYEYINTMQKELLKLDSAMKTNTWNPISNPLCRFCPVMKCAHNRKEIPFKFT